MECIAPRSARPWLHRRTEHPHRVPIAEESYDRLPEAGGRAWSNVKSTSSYYIYSRRLAAKNATTNYPYCYRCRGSNPVYEESSQPCEARREHNRVEHHCDGIRAEKARAAQRGGSEVSRVAFISGNPRSSKGIRNASTIWPRSGVGTCGSTSRGGGDRTATRRTFRQLRQNAVTHFLRDACASDVGLIEHKS